MARYPKIMPGQKMTGIPAGGWNAAMDVAQAFKEGKLEPIRTRQSMPGLSTDLGVEMWNDYTLIVPEDYALQVFKAMTNSGETDFLLAPVIESQDFNSTTFRFDAGQTFHRSRAPMGDGDELVRLYTAGVVPAMIYVHDANHRFCDVPYMTTNPDFTGGPLQLKYWETDWDGPHQILWKESGTGEKKALLRLGENRPRVLWGQATEAWRKRSTGWPYVRVGLIDYSSGNAGYESGRVVRVLLPTDASKDPNIIAGTVIGFVKTQSRVGTYPKFRYAAVTNNYYSGFIGETKTVLGSWSCPGWVLADGSQDTAKTRSGYAANASDRFIKYQKDANATGGGGAASFLSADVIGNIADHPAHIHGNVRALRAEAGGARWEISDPDTQPNTAQGHGPSDAGHEVEIDVPEPAWTGARLYERIDNSAGNEE